MPWVAACNLGRLARWRTGMMVWLLLVVFLSWLPNGALAQPQGRSLSTSAQAPVVELSPLTSIVEHNTRRNAWLDSTGQASAADAKSAARAGLFEVKDGLRPQRIPDGAALWYRIEARSKRLEEKLVAKPSARWYLEIGSPSVDAVSLHWLTTDGVWEARVAGDRYAVSSWPIPDHLPIFPISRDIAEDADGVVELWLRVQHDRVPIAFTLDILTESGLRVRRELTFFLFGAFFSGALLALGIAVVHGFVGKDRLFGVYAALLLVMLGMQSQLSGLAGLTLLHDSPVLNDRFSFLFAELYAFMGLLFVAAACRVTWGRGRLAIAIQVWMALSLTVMVLHQAVFNQHLFVVANIVMPATMLVMLSVCALAHQRGDRYALGVGLGLLPVVIAGALPLMRNQGWLPTSVLTQYGLMIGAALEVVILTWVLLARNRDLHESAIRERALLSVDALTGLTHESLFFQRVHMSAVRARRAKKRFGLVLLSIDNAGRLLDAGGFAALDRALVLAANHIREVAREIDTCSRVQPHDFAMLVEGPCTHQQLVDMGTRLLARTLRPSAQLPAGVQLKCHVTLMLLPGSPEQTLGVESEIGLSALECVRWLIVQSELYQTGVDKPVRFVDAPDGSGIV